MAFWVPIGQLVHLEEGFDPVAQQCTREGRLFGFIPSVEFMVELVLGIGRSGCCFMVCWQPRGRKRQLVQFWCFQQLRTIVLESRGSPGRNRCELVPKACKFACNVEA